MCPGMGGKNPDSTPAVRVSKLCEMKQDITAFIEISIFGGGCISVLLRRWGRGCVDISLCMRERERVRYRYWKDDTRKRGYHRMYEGEGGTV